MDDFSLLNIFDHLDFGDLANVAAIGPRYQQLIVDHYMIPAYKLPGKTVKILLSGRDESTGVSIYPSITTLLANGYSETLSTIISCCHLFSNLIIISDYIYPVKNDFVQNVSYAVNSFCRNTPLEISMEMSWRQKDKKFTFENATIVTLNIPEHGAVTDLNVYFPRMKVLKITVITSYTLNEHFPHLEQLSLCESDNGKFNLQTFGTQNPQIRRLRIRFDWDINHLDQMNNLFPQLEELHIDITKRPQQTGILGKLSNLLSIFGKKPVSSVHFRKVKSFTLETGRFDYNDWVQNGRLTLQFDELESFRVITYSRTYVNEQINLIAQYKEVTTVDFSSIRLTYEEMRRLLEVLPNLKAITVKCELSRTVDDILRLMTEESRLDVITAMVDENKRQIFLGMASLPGNWSTTKKSETKTSLTFHQN